MRLRNAVINDLLAASIVPVRARVAALRRFGIMIGEGSAVNARTALIGRDISIGGDTYIGAQCLLDGDGGITIGSHCDIASRVSIFTATHEIGSSTRRAGKRLLRPVQIGNGVWVGGGSTILPGVTIGDGCLISASAVVTKDCEPNGLYAGVPARRVRDLD